MAAMSSAAKRLASELRKAGISFEAGASIGGVQPDFLIEGSKGHKIALDLKSWKPTPAYLERAQNQVHHYKDSVGADGALVVMEGLTTSRPRKGLIAPQDLVEAVLAELAATEKKRRKRKKKKGAEERLVFAAMPFHKRYQDTYWFGMVPAAEKAGAVCKRLDAAHFSAEILQTMKTWIRKSVAVIADVSGSNPNVMYELGFAHALNKPVIQLTSTSLDELPFDVQTWPTLPYEIGAVSEVAPELTKRLRVLLKS